MKYVVNVTYEGNLGIIIDAATKENAILKAGQMFEGMTPGELYTNLSAYTIKGVKNITE